MSTTPIGTPTPQQLTTRKRNNAILWILAIVAGGFVILVIGSLIIAGMFVRHVRVDNSGKQVEIETPAGSLRVNGDQAHATGLPVYPGAQPLKSEGGANVEFSAQSGAGMGLANEKYSTSDDLDEVSDWYKQRLGPGYKREDRSTAKRSDQVSSNADVAYVYEKGDNVRVVALTKKSDGIEIELVRIGKKEVQ
jgi:hypothetical protein